jgi:hypothetical protein
MSIDHQSAKVSIPLMFPFASNLLHSTRSAGHPLWTTSTQGLLSLLGRPINGCSIQQEPEINFAPTRACIRRVRSTYGCEPGTVHTSPKGRYIRLLY